MVNSMQNINAKVWNRSDWLLERVEDKMIDRSKGHDKHSAIQESEKQWICRYHNKKYIPMEVKCVFFPKKREKGIISVLNRCENFSDVWEHSSFLSFNEIPWWNSVFSCSYLLLCQNNTRLVKWQPLHFKWSLTKTSKVVGHFSISGHVHLKWKE